MKDAFARTIVSNGADDILGVNLLTLGNRNRRKVTVNRYVTAVADEHIAGASELEDCRNHAGEDGTGTGSGTAHIVGSLILELHIFKPGNVIRAKTVANHVLAGDGDGQTAAVLLEGAVQLSVLGCEPCIGFERRWSAG